MSTENHIKPYLHHAKYYETDQMGIVHHSNYIRWMEEARMGASLEYHIATWRRTVSLVRLSP